MGDAAYNALARDATAEWFVRRAEEGHRILIAEEGAKILGLAVFGPNTLAAPADRELRNVYVEPQITSQGVGRSLVEASLDQMRRDGHGSVCLGVFPSNVRAIAFYERLGFVRHAIGTWTNHGVAFADQIMVRRL